MEHIIDMLNTMCFVFEFKMSRYTDIKPIEHEYLAKTLIISNVEYDKTKKFEIMMNDDEICSNDFFDEDVFKVATQKTNMSRAFLEIDPYTFYSLDPVGTRIKVQINEKVLDCRMLTILKKHDYESIDDVFAVHIKEK